jgi:hypothetical protein
VLAEIKNVRQIPGEPKRRWFSDTYFDLIVWLEADAILGFQLCYDKGKNEHALTWKSSAAYTHNRVDDGEENHGRYKATPILVADGSFDNRMIADRFLIESAEIDFTISLFVFDKLIRFGNNVATLKNQPLEEKQF